MTAVLEAIVDVPVHLDDVPVVLNDVQHCIDDVPVDIDVVQPLIDDDPVRRSGVHAGRNALDALRDPMFMVTIAVDVLTNVVP